jgi:drug/metabolite transporter (DMT)-like permease
MQMNRRQALALLGLGTLLFALGPALIKLLALRGGAFGLSNPGAVSFCNVLFVGNFCAGLVTLAVYGGRGLFVELWGLPRRTKGALWLGAIVSAIYPALLFTALERTSVINVVLLSRFNGIVFVALSYVFTHVVIRRAEALGYGVMAAGVILLVVVNNGGLRISTGELLVLGSTVFFALTEFISSEVLKACSIQAYVFFRNLVSSAIFFTTAVYLFGFEHFADAFAGDLWLLMMAYAAVAVVAAQLAWLNAAPVLPAQTVANSQLLNPGFSLLFAYLLLHEVPTALEGTVMGVILVGMLIPRAVDWIHARQDATPRWVFGAGLVGTH